MQPSLNALLLRIPAPANTPLAAAPRKAFRLAGALFDLEPLFATGTPGLALAGGGHEWHIAMPRTSLADANPWEVAHEAHARFSAGLGVAAGVVPDLIEPDLLRQWIH